MAPHLSHSDFFEQLEKLFARQKEAGHGSVTLTQKRLTHSEDTVLPSPEDPFPDLNPTGPVPILIRATNSKSKKNRADKVKVATVVKPDEIDGFYLRYADICKAGMTALKPRDRSKKKAKAKKKKPAAS